MPRLLALGLVSRQLHEGSINVRRFLSEAALGAVIVLNDFALVFRLC